MKAAGQHFIAAAAAEGLLLLHWGREIARADAADASPRSLPSGPDAPLRPALFPVNGFGYCGDPALLADGTHGPLFQFAIVDIDRSALRLTFRLQDEVAGAALTLVYALEACSGLLRASAAIRNEGAGLLRIQRLASLSLPAPDWAEEADLTYGTWSNEGRSVRTPIAAGRTERIGRAGRPGFDGGPFLLLSEADASDQRGRCAGFHLASSGGFSLAVERSVNGRAQISIAEYLDPGEVVLARDEEYATPDALAFVATRGFNEVSRAFHACARQTAPPGRRHRPVQLNTWEAAYFAIDEKRAMELATAAAAIGAERFVLDDGWFKGRNGPTSSLGDWTPDPEKFPRGLKPLIDHVEKLGLEFGLWVEPEMISEDSDLYRSHPDWILAAPGRPRPTGRRQLVLDLTREAVRDHVFRSIDGLLSSHSIKYLKWDCNRDLYPAASNGAAATRRQIAGLYNLLRRVRAAHPEASIESCASGGGRIDFGVLQFADRFWTSDSTDAIERVRIQRRASLFMPIEALGAHVGPSPNHWTGRRLPMSFRCLTALFGHFGVELDPAGLDPAETITLKNAISLYKAERAFLAEGELMRLDASSAGIDAELVQSVDRAYALVRILRTEEPSRPTTSRLRIEGFDAMAEHSISEIFIDGLPEEREVAIVSGAGLAETGLDADPPHAATGRLFRIRRL